MATFDDIPRLKCRPHPPHDSVLYATAVLAPREIPGNNLILIRDLGCL